MRISLKAKLTLSIVGSIIVFGTVAVMAVYFYSLNSLVNNEKRNILNVATEQSERTAEVINFAQDVSSSIAAQDFIVDYMAGETPVQQNKEVLEKVTLYNIEDKFSAIYLMDKEGDTLLSTAESFVGKNYSFRDYFKEAKKGTEYVDVSLGVTSKKLGYYFSSPIKSGENILGVVVCKLEPEIVNSTIDIIDEVENLHVMLTDSYGIVIHSDEEDRLYKSLGTMTVSDKEELEEKRRYESIDIESLQYQDVHNNIKSIVSSYSYEFYDDADGEQELITIVRMEDFPFYLAIEEEIDPLYEQASQIAIVLSGFVGGAALAAAFILYIVVSQFVDPMKTLIAGVEKYSKGNLDHQIEIKSKDELGDLANSFNNMSKNLKKSRENIEQKVEERTKDLEKLNEYMVGRELKMVELKKKLEHLKSDKQ